MKKYSKWLNVRETALACRVSPTTVRRWIRLRRLEARKPGRSYLINPDALTRLFDESPFPPNQ